MSGDKADSPARFTIRQHRVAIDLQEVESFLFDLRAALPPPLIFTSEKISSYTGWLC